jgi:hypothetical protein
VAGTRWLEDGWIDMSFVKPVYPGDHITIYIQPSLTISNTFDLQIKNNQGQVCMIASFGNGKADWSSEITRAIIDYKEDKNDTKVQLTMDNAPVGKNLKKTLVYDISQDRCTSYPE